MVNKMVLFRYILVFLLGVYCIKGEPPDPESIAIVINKDSSKLEDYVQITDPPPVFSGDQTSVHLEYRCTDERFLGIEVIGDVISVFKRTEAKVFKKIWRCHGNANTTASKMKRVKLKLPVNLAFNYNAFNKHVSTAAKTKIRAWIVDRKWWSFCVRHDDCYSRSSVKMSYDSAIHSPYTRPFKDYTRSNICKTWAWYIVFYSSSYSIPVCPQEKEVVQMIEYPVAVGGNFYGVIRQLDPFNNPDLEDRRILQATRPRFTVSMWLYILEYCPNSGRLCSVFHHFNWKGEYHTVIVFLTNEGKLHVQVEHTDGKQSAGLTFFKMPLHKWIWVVLTFNVNKWTATLKYGDNFDKTVSTDYTHRGEPVYYDDTEGLFAFGGSEYRASFRGYIGQSTLYRNKALDANQVPVVSRFHPMFELKLSHREERCSEYINWVNDRFQMHGARLQQLGLNKQEVCRPPFFELIMSVKQQTTPLPTCDKHSRKPTKHRKLADVIIRKMAASRDQVDFETLGAGLFNNATELIDTGIAHIPAAFPILKQGACCGNLDAMYMVAVILNNGIFVKTDEIQSQAYLMLAALENHRLSALALGHKHRYGVDGVTLDWEQSYRYHKFVADTTRQDKELHKDTDVFTESVRLTDEVALHEQTDEDGDIFHWLTHQAKQGVLSAQTRMARSLFWGHSGLKRNLQAAVEYFKMSAETGDPQSQYDYGIALFRGQGIEKDHKAGLQQIQKAAEQKNPAAINAVGWHSMHYEKDMDKAVENFEKAYRMGNADAAYNIGILYLTGKYPEHEKDADKALKYFYSAGLKGQMDAGVAIAYQTIKGTDTQPRDVYNAIEWSRFIAEKNPAIGFVLRKAVKAYRAGKRDVSLFYYALAADAGLEIASFNMAWLCEANEEGIASFIEKDCVWNKYNISTKREIQFVNTYALIKMGDYFWYGCQGNKDVTKATEMYVEAAKKHDPQAFFNLAFMLEEGVKLPRKVLRNIRVPHVYQLNNVTLLSYLYNRCRESHKSEGYMPCSIALWRIQILDFWQKHELFIKMAGVACVGIASIVSSFVAFRSHSIHGVANAI